jgi:hypothetical protein
MGQPGAAAEQRFAEDPCSCLPNFWQPRHRRDEKDVSTSVIARFALLCLRLLYSSPVRIATLFRANCAASSPPRRVNSSRAQSTTPPEALRTSTPAHHGDLRRLRTAEQRRREQALVWCCQQRHVWRTSSQHLRCDQLSRKHAYVWRRCHHRLIQCIWRPCGRHFRRHIWRRSCFRGQQPQQTQRRRSHILAVWRRISGLWQQLEQAQRRRRIRSGERTRPDTIFWFWLRLYVSACAFLAYRG